MLYLKIRLKTDSTTVVFPLDTGMKVLLDELKNNEDGAYHEWIVQIVEMTPEVFNRLNEFQGW
jgi:hypothetical protein